MLRFSPYFTFTPSSFHYDYLIPLLQGHMAIHVPSLQLIHFLSMTAVLLLDLTHMFMTQHLGI